MAKERLKLITVGGGKRIAFLTILFKIIEIFNSSNLN